MNWSIDISVLLYSLFQSRKDSHVIDPSIYGSYM